MIDVVLKCTDRSWDIVKIAQRWVDLFSLVPDHRLILWDDTKERVLRDRFDNGVKVVTRFDVPANEIWKLIKASDIDKRWYPPAFAHVAAWYVAKTSVFWNIDADDLYFTAEVPVELPLEIEQYVIKNDVFVISWDMHWTHHRWFAHLGYPHHWSFGVACCIRNHNRLRDVMKRVTPVSPPWSTNIDYLFQLAKSRHKILSMLFPNGLVSPEMYHGFDGENVYQLDRRTHEMMVLAPKDDVVVCQIRDWPETMVACLRKFKEVDE